MISASFNRFSNALEFVDKAVALSPERAEYLAQQARCQAMLRREGDAVETASKALRLEPQEALTLDTIGVVLSRAGAHQRAVEAFRRATAKEPRNPSYQFNLASSLKFLGDFDGAEAAYEAAAAANPRYYKVYSALSQLRRHTPESNHVQRLEELLGNVGDNIDGELHLRHALAKELEDLGEYGAAFEHLMVGNANKRNTIDYGFHQDAAIFDELKRVFPPGEPLDELIGDVGGDAIFVVGMPRTGTTLVERILSSHSRVVSAGELQDFGLVVKRAAGTKSNRVLDADTIRAARTVNHHSVGEAYLESARRAVPDSDFFIDKLPLNFLYIGFIRLALPGAKIICLRRHPLDTVLSNFRQLFALRFSYYNYSYDLEDTARYYLRFADLMAHWDTVMPGGMLQVNYEDLIADQEAQTRRMLDHCGLGWEAACLDFAKNTAPVSTASAVQVREPIYTRALSRWKKYEQQLEPARRILAEAGIAID
ncbi:MAG: sulfotransferase [Gammaproteobacteria bacterium]|nr:sulfotransferase [Gammaproteobacteria bacterium]